MASFYWKKNIEDPIKDELILTAKATVIFFGAKVDRYKTTIPGRYVYRKICRQNIGWCPCQRLCSLQKMDQIVTQQQHFTTL